MASTPEKKTIPLPGDNYNYTDEMKALAASIRDMVPVANRTEAESISTAMAADGRPITDANPLFVYNNETKNVEIKDSSGWRLMIATPPMGHVGCTDGFQTIGTGVVVGFSSAQVLRGGVTFNNVTDSLVVPVSGLYRFNFRVLCTGGGAYTNQCWLRVNTAQAGIYTFTYKPDVLDYTAQSSGILQLNANDQVQLWIETSTDAGGAATWGTNGYNGTYLEVEMIGV